MKKQIFLFAVITIIIMSCREGKKDASTARADSEFQKISEDFLTGTLAWQPEMAVSLGFHEYDGKTSDLSMNSIKNELGRLKSFDQKLDNLDKTLLSTGTLNDFRILKWSIRNTIFQFEEMEPYTKNPMTYAGSLDVSIYIKRNFAPIEDRLRFVIAVERNAPVLFANARTNLVDSIARPFIETAMQIAAGTVEFLEKDLPATFKGVKNDTLKTAFETSNKIAISEVNAFIEYLEKEKLPGANNNYALGRDKYEKMLQFGESVYLQADKILEIGLAQLENEKLAFGIAARIIDPEKTPGEVYHELEKDHPTAESLIPDIRKTVDSIRQFIINKKLVTLPAGANVLVEETPEYARSLSAASMDSPGPFEKKATEAYYYITPVDPAWTPKQKEEWLSTFNYYTSDFVTIHEVYPGHYTQFEHLNGSNASKTEKIFSSYAFVEGWAHYAEQMMIEEGYGDTGDSVKTARYHMAQSGEALLRLCRLCVSIKMHCMGMSVDEATKFFMDNWYQGEKPSRLEALRGTYDPGYLYYTLGKLMILKLREDYKRQEGGNFSLQKFNDLILDNGMPPILFLREKLLKDKNILDEVL